MAVLKDARHEKYCQIRHGGQTKDKSYVGAGYKPSRSHAARLDAKGHIQARLKELSEASAQEAVLDKAWVLIRLRTVAERCLQEEPVIVAGKPSGEFVFNSSGANRALELLGKEIGMFVDQSKRTVEVGDRLSELLKAIDGDTRGHPTPNGPSLNGKSNGATRH